ncbi:deoxyribodipyrimidine photo-lyase [Arsenicitalea aurantiaca]|uniref:Deoxyribodipyrimidine photo-lyase n=1 Tax=Arsenicitalea aurantiaca TaxID=1783274 RepID=A0A433XET8_9HYPH|nr:deoxyribodipyrimidine photo-lyase [Arsenicitalea aurantiaca]RUT32611.1 deoxyribodipyrimidine photo-lyase [Arsenicitalea aurantiaca]
MTSTALVWFRNDLRLTDNPALKAAMDQGDRVVALYIHETDPSLRPIGGAARWWLHHSLNALAEDLAGLGIELLIAEGKAGDEVRKAAKSHEAASLHWNRRYAPAEREVDGAIKTALGKDGLEVHSHAANVLVEPFDISTKDDRPYAVYSPFWKVLRGMDIPRPSPRPRRRTDPIKAGRVDKGYEAPKWSRKLGQHWEIGETAARAKLRTFLEDLVKDYPEGRDRPAEDATSRLSPHLRFGEIGPREVWHTAQAFAEEHGYLRSQIDKFLSELGWREFNYNQLYHREDIAKVSMQPKYENMKWRSPGSALARWQSGMTGLPMVDAGMRELWETGYMHNRVRMLTASLLSKNLLIDWRLGEEWFWDCLLDADGANNPGNWQWVAGSGLDASPYFRIFNPVTQGERFDPAGTYVRRWLPELAKLDDKHVHAPWKAPKEALKAAGISIGETYPAPIVDLKVSRERALDAAKGL